MNRESGKRFEHMNRSKKQRIWKLHIEGVYNLYCLPNTIKGMRLKTSCYNYSNPDKTHIELRFKFKIVTFITIKPWGYFCNLCGAISWGKYVYYSL